MRCLGICLLERKTRRCRRLASPWSAQRRLVQVLQLLDRMTIPEVDRLVAGCPIKQIDRLERRLEQNVRLAASCPRERLAADRSGTDQQADDRRDHSAVPQKLPNR